MEQAYAPTLTSSHDVKEEFYANLDHVIKKTPQSEKLVLLGDFNARVGRDHSSWAGVLGKHGIGKVNANGLLLLNKCAEHNLCITNTIQNARQVQDYLDAPKIKTLEHDRLYHCASAWHQGHAVNSRHERGRVLGRSLQWTFISHRHTKTDLRLSGHPITKASRGTHPILKSTSTY